MFSPIVKPFSRVSSITRGNVPVVEHFPMLARFYSMSPFSTFSPIIKPFSGVSAVTRGNVDVVERFLTLAHFCQKSSVSTFSPIVKPFSGVSAVTRGIERVVGGFHVARTRGTNDGPKDSVTSQDVSLEIERKQLCALHSCIENPGNFCEF
jgi:hypothetical protein